MDNKYKDSILVDWQCPSSYLGFLDERDSSRDYVYWFAMSIIERKINIFVLDILMSGRVFLIDLKLFL